MNTNDLPPQAKLAALIEAGRAANPDLKHGTGAYLHNGAACAIGFAHLACGISREHIRGCVRHAQITETFGGVLCNLVESRNDRGATLEEICTDLREGELAKMKLTIGA